MKLKKKVYLRKKGNIYTFDTQIKGKNVYLIGLPKDYYTFLLELSRLIVHLCPECEKQAKSSFFSRDKWSEIWQKLQSADIAFNKKELID